MRTNLLKKSTLTFLFLSGLTTFSYSQVVRPDALEPIEITETTAYAQNFDGIRAEKYPSGWGAWNVGAIQKGANPKINPRIAEALPAETIRRLNMGGGANTTVASVYTFNKRIGFKNGNSSDFAIYASFNTTAVPASKKIKISFDGIVMRNLYGAEGGDLVNALVLQYRIGDTGNFTTIGEAVRNGEVQRSSGGIPANQQSAAFVLPAECNGKSIVQLRWITKYISGTFPAVTDDIPSFAIDNFVAEVEK